MTLTRPSFCHSAKACALGDRDLQPIRIELEHRGIGDPGIGHQPARAASASRNNSEARPVTPAVVEDFLAADFLLPLSETAAMRKPSALAATRARP